MKEDRNLREHLTVVMQQGFTRVLTDGEVFKIEEIMDHCEQYDPSALFILIDRFTVDQTDEDFSSRMADSIQTAFFEGGGSCIVRYQNEENRGQENSQTALNLTE
jgi:excinuclease ABC subunit A